MQPQTFDTTQLLALAAALGWASGLRLYAVVFFTGLAGFAGLGAAARRPACAAAPAGAGRLRPDAGGGVLRRQDSGAGQLWDAVHTFIRIPAGAALAAAVFGGDQASLGQVAALMGGTLAATSHVAKATTRAAINTSPEPFSNIGLSLAGDAVVPAMLWLAWSAPAGVLGVGLALVLMVWLIVLSGPLPACRRARAATALRCAAAT
jgi:hypothetical protein